MEELEVKIESVREYLNKLVGEGDICRNDEIICISIKLNHLINQYYIRKKY